MTFESFIYKAQVFAVKLQQAKPGRFKKFALLKQSFGGIITMFLMQACFFRIYSIGEKQCQMKQKSAKSAIRK